MYKIQSFLFALAFLLPNLAQAQKAYFQQTVNTKIAVTLDDKKHRLNGDISIEYTNNSPDQLGEIWIHLWPNAYKNKQTALSKQFLRDGNGKFYFSPDTLLGGFRNLDFSVNGQKAEWKLDKKNPDIAVLKLASPLPPGGKISISTPFLLKIPKTVSRLGHVGESYQMTQWFPKPAVYDNRGWHAMPYLNQGEFYSEFGNYDVTITLPSNYVVGATGVLQTPSEVAFLRQKEAETKVKLAAKDIDFKKDPFPASSSDLKTIRYTAENVHDFAWFADKRFMVVKDTARLADGKTVDCWAMFTNSGANVWAKGAFFVKRSVEYYSSRVGAYPWPHATAVHSALSAGGGMEYPMITVINDEKTEKGLDDVITHEVGHNWFYGILASNERDHPWMDEGINTYYENSYMEQYYGTSQWDEMLPKSIVSKESGGAIELGSSLLSTYHRDFAPDSPSEDFTSIAYGVDVYGKTSFVMRWLEKSIGREKFDRLMQDYYREWKFKHPYPEDFEAILTKNGVKADWFSDLIKTTKQVDYALKNVEKTDSGYKLTVKNKAKVDAPFSISAIKDGKTIAEKWYDPIGNTATLDFPLAEKADKFILDNGHATLDVNRKNNVRKPGFLGGMEPPALRLLAPAVHPQKTTIGILPWVGWNDYDKTMAGVVLYNPLIPSRGFQYYIAPGFGTGSKQLVGLADLKYRFFPSAVFHKVTLGLSGKTADFDYNFRDNYYLKYHRLVPSVNLEFNSPSNTFRHSLNLRTLFIGQDYANYDSLGYTKINGKSKIYEARYEARQERLPNPYRFTASLEYQDYKDLFEREGNYLLARLDWNQKLYYKDKKKVTMRFFAGFHLKNTGKERKTLGFSNPQDFVRGSLTLSQNGYTDYKYDNVFLGRSEDTGILARQINESEGGFKYGFGQSRSSSVGHSNAYILSVNMKADLPQKLPLGLPLKPWFDVGYAKNLHSPGGGEPLTFNDQLFWSGGFMLEFFKGNLNVYFPLVNSKNLRAEYCSASGGTGGNGIFCGGNYLKWISWSLNLNDLDPVDMIDRNLK